jgi:ankyrin repeat protein
MPSQLHAAARRGQVADATIVAALLASGQCSPDQADRFGQTALHAACIRGDKSIKVIASLIAGGASVSAVDMRCCTPLHYAAANDARKIVTALLGAAGIDPSAADVDGATPLHRAAARNLADMCKILTGQDDAVPGWYPKADHTAKDHHGKTALEWAVRRECNAEQLGEGAIVKVLKPLQPPKATPAYLQTPTSVSAPKAAIAAAAAAAVTPAVKLASGQLKRAAAPCPRQSMRGFAAEDNYIIRLERAKIDRRSCPVGKPATARWEAQGPTARWGCQPDPWLSRFLLRQEAKGLR